MTIAAMLSAAVLLCGEYSLDAHNCKDMYLKERIKMVKKHDKTKDMHQKALYLMEIRLISKQAGVK